MAGLDVFEDLDADTVSVFGETVDYTPIDPPNATVSVTGIFFTSSRPLEELDAPIRVQANIPSILLHTSAVAQPKRGDTVVRTQRPDGKTYFVDHVERDEGALWNLTLKEQ